MNSVTNTGRKPRGDGSAREASRHKRRLHLHGIEACPPGYDPEIEEVFSQMRKALNLSVEAVALRLDTSLNVIQALERGDVRALPPWRETERVTRRFADLLRLDARPILRRLSWALAVNSENGAKASREGTLPPPSVSPKLSTKPDHPENLSPQGHEALTTSPSSGQSRRGKQTPPQHTAWQKQGTHRPTASATSAPQTFGSHAPAPTPSAPTSSPATRWVLQPDERPVGLGRTRMPGRSSPSHSFPARPRTPAYKVKLFVGLGVFFLLALVGLGAYWAQDTDRVIRTLLGISDFLSHMLSGRLENWPGFRSLF